MADVCLKAKRLGVHDEHVAKVKTVGDRLFRKLQKLHKLNAGWKKYLLAAGIIHPAGKSISTAHNDQHSYYIAKNMDIPLMAHPAFADAVERFLAKEGKGIENYLEHLDERSPFRRTEA